MRCMHPQYELDGLCMEVILLLFCFFFVKRKRFKLRAAIRKAT